MTDLVIGMGDDTPQNRHDTFIRSVRQSGFTGDLKVFTKDPLPWHPVVDRWKLIADYIWHGDFDRVIACDTFDVVFQYNPFEWLDKNPAPIVLVSEEKNFEQCEGNKRGMLDAFPQFWDAVKDKDIMNAGIIAGWAGNVASLCDDIYNLCQQDARLPKFTPKFQDRLPDQQALNIQMYAREHIYDRCVAGGKDAWAFQYNHKHEMRDGVMYNEHGTPYAILHQYLYQWKEEVQRRYA